MENSLRLPFDNGEEHSDDLIGDRTSSGLLRDMKVADKSSLTDSGNKTFQDMSPPSKAPFQIPTYSDPVSGIIFPTPFFRVDTPPYWSRFSVDVEAGSPVGIS